MCKKMIKLIRNFKFKIECKWPVQRYLHIMEYDEKTERVRYRRGWQFGPFKIHGPYYT